LKRFEKVNLGLGRNLSANDCDFAAYWNLQPTLDDFSDLWRLQRLCLRNYRQTREAADSAACKQSLQTTLDFGSASENTGEHFG